jgi:cellulase
MKSAFAFLSLAASVSAHAIFQQIYVNGVSPGHKKAIRIPANNGPVEDVSSPNLACNAGLTSSPDVVTVPAGATVTVEWHHTLDPSQNGQGDDPISTTHKGPVMTYLAAVSNATTASPNGLGWFKIHEDGYNPSTELWAVDKLNAAGGKVTFTVPSCIKAGQYLLRHEILALHSAQSYPGAQFYMACAQIQITGSGTATPGTVSIPGAYSGSDSGVKISIYYPKITNYIIPGPRPFTCSGSGSGSTGGGSSTPTSTSTSTTSSPTSTSSGGVVAKYGQCGGASYQGPTQCEAGSTCTVLNQHYHQCL